MNLRYLVETLFSYLHNNILLFYIIIYMYILIIIINDLLVRVSTCVDHLQITVKLTEFFCSLLYLRDNWWWWDMCTGLCCFFDGCFLSCVFCFSFVGLLHKKSEFFVMVFVTFRWWFCLLKLHAWKFLRGCYVFFCDVLRPVCFLLCRIMPVCFGRRKNWSCCFYGICTVLKFHWEHAVYLSYVLTGAVVAFRLICAY